MIRFIAFALLLTFAAWPSIAFAQADRLDRIDTKLMSIEAKLDKLLAASQPQQVSAGPATVRLADGTTFTGPQSPGVCTVGGNCTPQATCGVNGCLGTTGGFCDPRGSCTPVTGVSSGGGCGSGNGLFSRLRERRAARRGG